MKKLFPAGDSLANRISYYHMVLLLVSLPYDRFYSHLILISFIIHTFIHLKKNGVKPVFTLPNLALSSVFLLTVAGTLYSINRHEAFNEWSRQLVILLMPVVLCLNPIDLKKYRDNLLLTFGLSSTAAIIYLYLQAFRTIRFYHLPWQELFSPAFTNHNFPGPLDIHATFFSMQIALALAYLLNVLIKTSSVHYKILLLFCCAILAAGIIQLSSKSVFVALLIIVNIAIPCFALKGRARVKYSLATLSISALIITGIYQMDNFKERYVTDLKKDLSKATAEELFDPRLARWQVALKLASNAPLIGYGSGSERALLKDRYFEHKFFRSYLAGLNAHNQFISFIIKTGLIGLVVYLATLYFGFKASIDNNDLMLFAFMVIISAVSFSENFLDVDKGVFFYSIFFPLLLFSVRQKSTVIRAKATHNNLVTGNPKRVSSVIITES
jgi:O-antigen ligase